MKHDYAKRKLTSLLADDLTSYTDGEFARQMMRVIDGATGFKIEQMFEQNALLAQRVQELQNGVLGRRVVELTETVTTLRNQLAAKPSDSGYAKLHAERDSALAASRYSADVCEQALAARKELAAQVEQLRDAYKAVSKKIHDIDDTETDSEEIADALWQDLFQSLREGYEICQATPAQCLAEHEADIRQKTIEPILSKLRAACGETTHPRAKVYLCEEALELCLVEINKINQIRQQAKAGSNE